MTAAMSALHKFRTEGGQVLTWKTGRCLRGVGDKVSLRGTVKKHSEYKGRKETELARCAVAK